MEAKARLGEKFQVLSRRMSRCNNVLWISGGVGAKQEDVSMDG